MTPMSDLPTPGAMAGAIENLRAMLHAERAQAATAIREAREQARAEGWAEGRARGYADGQRECAAYALDRADKYPTDSGFWVALADVAENIMSGEAKAAADHGELEDLYPRVEAWRPRGSPSAGQPTPAALGASAVGASPLEWEENSVSPGLFAARSTPTWINISACEQADRESPPLICISVHAPTEAAAKAEAERIARCAGLLAQPPAGEPLRGVVATPTTAIATLEWAARFFRTQNRSDEKMTGAEVAEELLSLRSTRWARGEITIYDTRDCVPHTASAVPASPSGQPPAEGQPRGKP